MIMAVQREANDMLPIYEKTRRYLLLEKCTVLAQHREGGLPAWQLTNPTEQHALGVHTWRSLNGAWIETMWQRRSEETFVAYRVRMVDEAHRWPRFPTYVELYDIIGDPAVPRSVDVEAMSEMLMAGIKRVEKNTGIK